MQCQSTGHLRPLADDLGCLRGVGLLGFDLRCLAALTETGRESTARAGFHRLIRVRSKAFATLGQKGLTFLEAAVQLGIYCLKLCCAFVCRTGQGSPKLIGFCAKTSERRNCCRNFRRVTATRGVIDNGRNGWKAVVSGPCSHHGGDQGEWPTLRQKYKRRDWLDAANVRKKDWRRIECPPRSNERP